MIVSSVQKCKTLQATIWQDLKDLQSSLQSNVSTMSRYHFRKEGHKYPCVFHLINIDVSLSETY